MALSTNKNIALDALMPLIREQIASGGTVEFYPRGISMLPMLRQGKDTVTLSAPPKQLKKYDLPLYVRDDGQYVLHRVVNVGETYSCIGDRQFKLEHGVRHDQIIAVAIAFSREGKTISTSSFTYKLYCRFWHNSRGVRHLCHKVIFKLKHILKHIAPND